MELCHTWTKRFPLVRGTILIIDGLFKRFSSKTSKVHVQTCTPSSKHLSIRNSMSVDSQWRRRLETKHHSKANIAGDSKAFERWAKHWQSCATRAFEHVQEWSKKISGDSKKFRSKMQTTFEMRWQIMIDFEYLKIMI